MIIINFDRKLRDWLVMGLVAVMTTCVMGKTVNTINVTKFHQLYPYSGKATVEYTIGGTLPANAVARIVISTDDLSATFIQRNIVTGPNKHVIDFASSFGGALVLNKASFVVTIMMDLGGVQLWKNGPYWAECNVGATKPEGYGYYFWWGDTVGYIRNIPIALFNHPTYGKDNAALSSTGYIDLTGNLAPAHDAATVYLGSPWRMPTAAEFDALTWNCTTIWTTRNGVNGRLVTGRGDYADKSIFLPAAGQADYDGVGSVGSGGFYWSSTSCSDSTSASYLYFFSGIIRQLDSYRHGGQSVRPVRESVQQCDAVGYVTYDPPSQTTPIISVVVANGCEAMGKVTGGTTAKIGTKLTLKATANKGYVFSHWEGPLGNAVDPRSSSVTYVVGEEDVQFVAYFIPASDAGSGSVIPFNASTYVGYLTSGDNVAGTIQAKVAKPKNGSAKVTVVLEVQGAKKVTIKGEMDVSTGLFLGTTKEGQAIFLSFAMNSISGDFDGLGVIGARDLFSSKDKTEKAEAEEILNPYLGALNMICDGGTLSVTIAKKGKVTIKGTIDGAKVSAKAQALIGEEMICIPVIYSKKSVNLAFTIWLPLDGGEAQVIGLDNAVIGKAGTLKNGATFMIDGDIAEYIETEDARTLELMPNDEIITVSGSKWLVADGIKAAKVAYKKGELTITEGKKGAGIVNPSGLKFTYKPKDGSFKGSFTAYAIVKGKLKKHMATVEGILINGIGYGTATIKKIGSWPIVIE